MGQKQATINRTFLFGILERALLCQRSLSFKWNKCRQFFLIAWHRNYSIGLFKSLGYPCFSVIKLIISSYFLLSLKDHIRGQENLFIITFNQRINYEFNYLSGNLNLY